jgi:3-dehydroquinate dehydratase I
VTTADRPRICASIVNEDLKAVKMVEDQVELFEVRIDLIGNRWEKVALQLNKPWIACNRRRAEGGNWLGNDIDRIEELLKALDLGAAIVDVELETQNIAEIVKSIKVKAKCLLSFHQPQWMLPLNELRYIVQRQLENGADICKVVTTAQNFEDNLTALQINSEFPESRVISFTMGDLGLVSRVFCPLVGADFTYASIERGKESAPGQITVGELRRIYGMRSIRKIR